MERTVKPLLQAGDVLIGLTRLKTLGRLRSVSPLMHRLFSRIEGLALSDCPVLIQGETGSGKLLVATELHAAATLRKRGPLVRIPCTGLSAAQLEEAVYQAAPPTQRRPRPSRRPEDPRVSAANQPLSALARARGGTLILQDVASLDPQCQASLIRFLNRQPSIEDLRRRSHRSRRARIVSTASVNLAQMVRQGHFRMDLYHRLAAATLDIPSLCARRVDVPLLVADRMEHWAAAHACRAPILEAPALHLLTAYCWPGNIRELHNLVEQLLLITLGRPTITDGDIRSLLCEAKAPLHIEIPVGVTLAQAEREVIMRTVAAHGGKRQHTAATLGISRRTLYAKLAQYRRDAEGVATPNRGSTADGG